MLYYGLDKGIARFELSERAISFVLCPIEQTFFHWSPYSDAQRPYRA